MHIFLEKQAHFFFPYYSLHLGDWKKLVITMYQKPDCVIALDPEFNPVLYNWTHDLLLTDLRSVLLVL